MSALAPAPSVDRVSKTFANGVVALEDVSLTLAPGEFVALLGPSGCGKSTLLRLVAGLDSPTRGQVHTPAPGSTAFVFQDPTLMPWATVFDNVWLPLRLQGVTRAGAHERVMAVLERVGLGAFGPCLPTELSGGMRMRVSMARALVTQPRVLLMDEPFAALDEITRYQLNTDVLTWQQGSDITTLFVTHSVLEAVYLSQRVLVMSARPGRISAAFDIDGPTQRTAAWRNSAACAAQCGAVSEALEAASSGPSQ